MKFIFTPELAWHTLTDTLENRGVRARYGSKDTTRAAFRAGSVENGGARMDMIASRHLTPHTSDESTASRSASAVIRGYLDEFERLHPTLKSTKQEEHT